LPTRGWADVESAVPEAAADAVASVAYESADYIIEVGHLLHVGAHAKVSETKGRKFRGWTASTRRRTRESE